MRKRWIALGLLALAAAGAGSYYNGLLQKEKEASSPTAIEAIERVRKDYMDYVVHEETVDGGKVVIYLHYYDNGGFNIQADYAKRTRFGWQYVIGGGFGGSGLERQEGSQPMPLDPVLAQKSYLNLLNMYLRGTEGTEVGRTPFPMYLGAILDPEVSSVVVTSLKDGLDKQAKIIPINDYFKVYFVFVDEAQGTKFRIASYDGNGRKLLEQERDEGAAYGFRSGASASATASPGPT